MAQRRKAAATVGDIQDELSALRQDLGDLADQVTDLLSGKGEEVIDDVKQRVTRIREGLDSALGDVGARGRAAVHDAKGNIQDLGGTIEDTVREHPFTMLALAIGLGVVVGTTLRR